MLTLASTCLRYVVHSAFHLIQYATSVAKSLQVLTAREERVMASVETGCDTLGREYRQSNHVWAAVFALLMVGGILPPYPANADEQFRVAPVVLGYRLTSGWKDTSGMLFGSPLDAIQFAYEGVKICAGASHPERAYEEYQPDQYTKLFWAGWYYIVTPPPQVPGCDPPRQSWTLPRTRLRREDHLPVGQRQLHHVGISKRNRLSVLREIELGEAAEQATA
jgi:hypothetical protein